jgi:FAD/FMN-containing dehydrogenase
MPDTIPAENIAAALVELMGQSAVIAQPAAMEPYLAERRRRFHAPATAIVLPADTAGVQKLMAWANTHGVSIIPQGGNTGLVGAQVPVNGNEVILSLTRLNAIRSVDAAAGHFTAEAGVILHEAHEAAEAVGAIFPLWLGSQGSARIGGVLSSNAGGIQTLAYGNARELCLGIEAVLPDGRLYAGLNSLRKNNTGYDLKDLLIGAEGTLGVITAATLKLYPAPEGYETALVNVESPEAALEFFALVRDRAGPSLTAFELMPRLCIDLVLRHGMLERDLAAGLSPWYVLLELSRPRGAATDTLQSALEAAFEAGMVTDAVFAESLAQRQALWTMRENMSDVQSREGASIKHDVSVPISAVPKLIAEGIAAATARLPGIRPLPFGHFGDGNIHFNFTQPVGADPVAYMAEHDEPIHDLIYEIVLRLGGSVSAEHGIGQLKTGLLKKTKDPVALQMMAAIKQALDPNGILNPGKLLG